MKKQMNPVAFEKLPIRRKKKRLRDHLIIASIQTIILAVIQTIVLTFKFVWMIIWAHYLWFNALGRLPKYGKTIAWIAALVEVVAIGVALHEDKVTVRDELLYNDAGHQMMQVGSSNKLLDPLKSIKLSNRLAKQLTKDRGYTITGIRVEQANPQIFKNPQAKHGPAPVNVPGPVPFGFTEADGTQSIGYYLDNFPLNTAEFRKFNPGLADEKNEYMPPAGTIIKLRPDYDTSVALTKLKVPMHEMLYGSKRWMQADRLAKLNSAAFVYGRGPVKAGDSAYLPLEQTKFMKYGNIEVSDVIEAYNDNYEQMPKTQAIEPKKRRPAPTLSPSAFARKTVASFKQEQANWPTGQTDQWQGVENSNPFLKRYVRGKLGPKQAWCAWLLRYLLNQSGANISVTEHLAGRSYYTPRVLGMYGYMVNDNNRKWYVYSRTALNNRQTTARVGDVVFFNEYGSMTKFLASNGNHVGLIVGANANSLQIGEGNYDNVDKVAVRTISRNDRRIMAVSRRVNLPPIKHGVKIPELQELTHEQSVKATDALKARGPEWHYRATAIRYYMDVAKLEDYQAIGLIGGYQVESDSVALEPAREQYNGGPGIGLAQWEGGRKERLIAFAAARGKAWTDFQTQLEFSNEEFNGTEKRAYEWLSSTVGIEGAANAAMNGYERPRDRNVTPRLANAARLYTEYLKAAGRG